MTNYMKQISDIEKEGKEKKRAGKGRVIFWTLLVILTMLYVWRVIYVYTNNIALVDESGNPRIVYKGKTYYELALFNDNPINLGWFTGKRLGYAMRKDDMIQDFILGKTSIYSVEYDKEEDFLVQDSLFFGGLYATEEAQEKINAYKDDKSFQKSEVTGIILEDNSYEYSTYITDPETVKYIQSLFQRKGKKLCYDEDKCTYNGILLIHYCCNNYPIFFEKGNITFMKNKTILTNGKGICGIDIKDERLKKITKKYEEKLEKEKLEE